MTKVFKNPFKKTKINKYPIFIGGEGRSGTTLMRAMLNNHPKIACGPETHFLNDPDFQKLLDILIERYSYRIREYNTFPEQEFCEMYASMISSFFEKYASARSKGRWADKTPYNIKSVDFLLKVFQGQIRFIHMVRDGRDVASSILTMDWGAKTVEEAAERWKNIIMNSRKHLGENYFFELKYEDLVMNQEDSLRKVCKFIGEKFHPSMLEYYKDDALGGEKESSYSQIRKPVYNKAIGRWKKDLTPKQVKKFMKVAGDTIELLGYEIDKA